MAPTKQNKVKLTRWYKADDEQVHFARKRNAPKPQKLRRGVAPGQVLILLAGRFRGSRVVFLKQLQSGLLLVSGPFKVNGVPLKRVNQSQVQPTSTKVDLTGVKTDAVNDAFFARSVPKRVRKSADSVFAQPAQLTAEQQKVEEQRRTVRLQQQKEVDTALLANVKKVDLLKQYLASRFTLSNKTRVHDLVF